MNEVDGAEMEKVQEQGLSNLSSEQLEDLGDRLRSKRQELVNMVKSHKSVVESRHDCDVLNSADSASFNESHDRAVVMSNRHKEELVEIDAALERMSNGRYGLSESTGEPIAFERLLVIPWARTGHEG